MPNSDNFSTHHGRLESEGIQLLETMLLIRLSENRIVELYSEQEMRTPVHLCIGQEAVPAGVSIHLHKDDYIFSPHRCHGHYLAKGGDLNKFAAELYCREGGCSGGKGGSMHLVDVENGICGTTAIVGGSLPISLGTALASKLRKDRKVTICFFGDGASEEGSFHESLNIAALKKLPVIFVQENNLYATSSHIGSRQAYKGGSALAPGYGIPSMLLDGNDALVVSEALESAVERARNGGGPSFFECLTYRWMDHVGHQDGLEKGYRSKEEWTHWQQRCPVAKLKQQLVESEIVSPTEIATLERALSERVKDAFTLGKNSPWPSKQSLYDNV